MIRLISSLLLLTACTHSVPAPRSPLVETSLDERPPRPPDARATEHPSPPRMPAVTERVLPGATLWLVEQPGNERVTIRVSTRRGNDGTYGDETMRALLITLEETLEDRLPGYQATAFVNAHTAAVEVVVRSDDAPATLRALGAVLDGPIDGAIARRVLGVPRDGTRAADHVRPYLFQGVADPLVADSAEALALCRDERFSSSDRLITVVGDFDAGELLAIGAETFADAHETRRIHRGETTPLLPERAATMHEARLLTVNFAFAAPAPSDEHYDAFVLLLNMSEGPLQLAPTDHAGALPPRVRTSLDDDRPGAVALLGARGTPAHSVALFESMFRHLQELSTRGFTLEAIERGRAQRWATAQAWIDSEPSSILAEAFARGLTPAQFEARYRALGALTPESLQALLHQYFTPERMMVLVRGPRELLERFQLLRGSDGFELRVTPERE